MEENPFFSLVENIEKVAGGGTTAFRIGSVLTASPLTMDVCDTIQDRDSFAGKAVGVTLTPGDKVLLANMDDDQSYIILCKVEEL